MTQIELDTPRTTTAEPRLRRWPASVRLARRLADDVRDIVDTSLHEPPPSWLMTEFALRQLHF